MRFLWLLLNEEILLIKPATYPKIGQFEYLVATREQYILRLQVWMDDSFLVYKFQSKTNL